MSIASAPASTTSPPLQVFTSPQPAAPGCSMPRREDFVPEVPVAPAKWQQVITCKPTCSVPDAPREPTKRQLVALRKSALFPPSSQLHRAPVVQLLALVSLNCHRYHSSHSGLDALMARFWLLSVVQVPALASSLLPPGATLINKTIVLLSITVLRSLSFLIPH